MQKLIIALILFTSTASMAQQTTVKGAFLEKWNNSRDYLIAVAEAMPEEFYDYKPTERQKSFKEQLLHMQGNMNWLNTSYFVKNEGDKEKVDYFTFNKKDTIELLQSSFDEVYKTIEATPEKDLKDIVDFFAGPKSKLQIMNLLQDHVTHHRGQLLVYLNLKGITPPKFSGW
ncbi:DinB family protein [Nonlabens sp. Asnod3-A02]|uniref:DinB family protein n=1 Tax=Nonlabens sp. Asnod3-A02 TaxID=3160579 RepID=UPI00386A3212